MRKAQVVATKQQSHVLNEKNILGNHAAPQPLHPYPLLILRSSPRVWTAMMEHPFILALVNTYQV